MVQSSTAPTLVVIAGFSSGFEDFLLLSLHRDVELDGPVGPAKFLRKIDFPLRGRVLLCQVSKLEVLQVKSRAAVDFACVRLRGVVGELDIRNALGKIRIASRAGGIILSHEIARCPRRPGPAR